MPQSMPIGLQRQSDDEFIDDHLQRTSRTFALAIPLLAADRRRQIGLSYLLFRVADSIEDAPCSDASLKKQLLLALLNHFDANRHASVQNVSVQLPATPTDILNVDAKHHFIHQLPVGEERSDRNLLTGRALAGLWETGSDTERLLVEFPRLWSIFISLSPDVGRVIAKALTSTIAGMIQFIDASRDQPNQIQIQTVADLRLYCYAVAGIVGELLTDIFVLHHPLGLVEYQELRRLSVGFGEFLQLINILKDSTQDASDGRIFIPCEVSREHVQELALAGQQDAVMYIRLLEKADFPSDVISYCRFLFLLANRSLERLREGGAGSKVSREEVLRMLSDVKSESFVLPT